MILIRWMLTDSCGPLPISRTSIRFQITVPASCSNRAGTWHSVFEVKTSLCIGPSPKQKIAQNAQTSGFWFCQVRQFNRIAHRKLRAQVDDVDSVKRTNCRCETGIGGQALNAGQNPQAQATSCSKPNERVAHRFCRLEFSPAFQQGDFV